MFGRPRPGLEGAYSTAFGLTLRNVILRKLFQPFAAQTNLGCLGESFIFAPALLDHAINHHERSDAIGAGAVNEDRMVRWLFDESNEFIRLLRARRGRDDRNIEVPQLVFFDHGALAKKIHALIGGAQAQDRMKTARSRLGISLVHG